MIGSDERTELRVVFDALNDTLAARGLESELCAAGGTVIPLVFHSEPKSRNVKSLFAGAQRLQEAANEVGAARELDPRWLSFAVRDFLSSAPRPFLDLSHLRVYDGNPGYLLAMKCASLHADASYDALEDIRYLLRFLDLHDPESAQRTIRPFLSDRQLPATARATLEELTGGHW